MTNRLLPIAIVVLVASSAHAQTVFFDDFNGDELLPHWNTPDPSAWEYNVSGGMLNVTGLNYPSDPKSPGNFAFLSTAITPLTDFQVDVWMGWDPASYPHRLAVELYSSPGGGTIVAQFGYWNLAGAGEIYASASGQLVTMPAPDPGMQHFTISRSGTQVNFLFNGTLFGSLSGTSGTAIRGVAFFFVGPYPGELGDFHIDQIQVVPAPSSFMLIVLIALKCASRRRS